MKSPMTPLYFMHYILRSYATRGVEISQMQIAVLITIVTIVIKLELNVEEVSTTIKKANAEKLTDDEVWMSATEN